MIYLPETMKNWPWPRQINPLYEEVTAESNAWFKTFRAFNEKSQYAFDKGDFGRLAALLYPSASKEHLRTGVDMMNVLFAIDEYTDVEPEHTVRKIVDVVIDALNNPDKPRPEGEIILGEIARQFWALAIKTATPESQRHFLESCMDYLEHVVRQAADRDNNTRHTVESYLQLRRQDVGVRPAFVPSELHLRIPDCAFYHPVIQELSYHIVDLVILDNDLVSYNKEQATGDDHHNIITVVMRQFGLEMQAAIDWVARYHEAVEAKFIDGLVKIPSWGKEIDDQVTEYVYHGLANWPRANDCWNFEGGRYLGSSGSEYQATRYVPLYPKKSKHDPVLRQDGVVVPLVDNFLL